MRAGLPSTQEEARCELYRSCWSSWFFVEAVDLLAPDAAGLILAVASGPGDPTRWGRGFSVDELHLWDEGSRVMANAIDLSLFAN